MFELGVLDLPFVWLYFRMGREEDVATIGVGRGI